MVRKRSGPRFEGFQGPNYTMVPNELFDRLMPELSGAELKVLLYVVRRTFGFKKDADAISLSQMLRGIRTRDGRVLDRGVGLAKNTLLGALASLEAKNVILIERRQSAERGNEPNVYRLNVVGAYPAPIGEAPLAQKEDQGAGALPAPSAQKEDKGVGAERAPALAWEGRQGVGSADAPGPWRNNRYPQEKEQQEKDRQGESSQETAEHHKARSTGSNSRIPGGPGASLSGDGAAPVARRRVYDPERRLILEYMADFARELSDQASLVSTTSRAVNLFRRSERTIEEFTEALLQARSITKERTQTIRAERRDPTSALPVRPKMAFFFAVLEDLLGLRPPDRPLPAQDATPAADERGQVRAGSSGSQPAAPNGADLPVEPADDRSSGLLPAPGPRQAWEIAQEELRRTLSGASFETWVRQARAVSHRRRTFTVAVPSTFAREWLETRLRRPVEEALERVLGEPTALAVVVGRSGDGDGTDASVPSRPRGRRPRARGGLPSGAGGASASDRRP